MIPPDTIPSFTPTRWTLVLRAQGESAEARVALGELCEHYYDPVLRFLRREGRGEDDAAELAQEFFARVLSGSGFVGAERERGRFRSYLLGALKHFLSDQRRQQDRLKRGGGVTSESLDALRIEGVDGSPPVELADPAAGAPDVGFDREWALTVMGRALATVEKEMADTAKREQFDALKPWLVGDGSALSQAETARNLGISEGALKVAVHRLRKRFREIVRVEIPRLCAIRRWWMKN